MNISRTLGLSELRGSMQSLMFAGAGAVGQTLASDFVLNRMSDTVKEKINGSYLEPVAHAVLGMAGYVALKKLTKNDALALGAAASGMAMAITTGYQFLSGNRVSTTTTPSVAGLGIFAQTPRQLLLAGSPVTYESSPGVAGLGMVSIEEQGHMPAASFMS